MLFSLIKDIFKRPADKVALPAKGSSGIRRLHIGGKIMHPDWEILNAVDGDHVDHLCDAANLSRFEDETFSQIYASHVLEHFDYRDDLEAVLVEWYRVLKPGGDLMVSVPDLDLLAQLFLDKESFGISERFHIMRMIFGGHVDKYDYHLVGLNEEFLTEYLLAAGFQEIKRVDDFGIFQDTSLTECAGVKISLSLICKKPDSSSPMDAASFVSESSAT